MTVALFGAGTAIVTCLVAWWLTGRVRRYALTHNLVDVPNARSSHVVATPRGGGMAIVIAALLAFALLGVFGRGAWPEVWTLVVGGAGVAMIGFADDHVHVAPWWRLLGHFSVAFWTLSCIGGLPPLVVFGSTVELGWFGHGLAAIYVVWSINLTNFMDGIDGIASVEVITVCAGGAILCSVAVPGHLGWVVPIVLAAATLGFLAWNWPPAKIFMGDGASGFLGFMLAVLSLQAAWVAPRLFWAWVILLGAFVSDASLTLLRRLLRRAGVFDAHRSHAYQHAARRWGSHLTVTLAVAAINIGWLFPMALMVALGRLDGAVGVLLAYAPLLVLAVWLKAGAESYP